MPEADTQNVIIEPPTTNKVMAFAIAASAAFIALVFVTNVDAALFQLGMLAAAAVAGLYAYRTARTRAVARRDGISIHNLRRTTESRWVDVDHLAVVQLDNSQGTGIDVVLTTGERIPVEASWGSWYNPSRAEANTKRCEDFLKEVGGLRSKMGHVSKDDDTVPPPEIAISWVTAFLDFPADQWDEGVRFWTRATRSKLSTPRGATAEFTTLIPEEGDAYLRMQRINAGEPRIHLDLHVDSLHDAKERAGALGATLLAENGHIVMRSPAGLTFCFVTSDGGEAVVPPPEATHTPNRLDQVCIDIPNADFDRECTFWTALTGWQLQKGSRVEFRSLKRPTGIPLRMLLQRLGKTDERTMASAHLDFAVGEHFMDILMRHDRYDSVRIDQRDRWTVMQDPTGLPYCLTKRDPEVDAPA